MRNPSLHLFHGVTHVVIVACNYPLCAYMNCNFASFPAYICCASSHQLFTTPLGLLQTCSFNFWHYHPYILQHFNEMFFLYFILCGRSVCQAVWQAVLSISTSTFYSLRKHFLDGKCSDQNMRIRSLALKSMAAVAWTNSYFSRVGDKRPDKDGIFTILPLGKVYL